MILKSKKMKFITLEIAITNIKAAGAVDREYAIMLFIRSPFVVLTCTCWDTSENQQMQSAFELRVGLLVGFLKDSFLFCHVFCLTY